MIFSTLISTLISTILKLFSYSADNLFSSNTLDDKRLMSLLFITPSEKLTKSIFKIYIMISVNIYSVNTNNLKFSHKVEGGPIIWHGISGRLGRKIKVSSMVESSLKFPNKKTQMRESFRNFGKFSAKWRLPSFRICDHLHGYSIYDDSRHTERFNAESIINFGRKLNPFFFTLIH